jgi:hypothetical protein
MTRAYPAMFKLVMRSNDIVSTFKKRRGDEGRGKRREEEGRGGKRREEEGRGGKLTFSCSFRR